MIRQLMCDTSPPRDARQRDEPRGTSVRLGACGSADQRTPSCAESGWALPPGQQSLMQLPDDDAAVYRLGALHSVPHVGQVMEDAICVVPSRGG